MRDYEVTVVLKPDLDDEARAEVLGRISGWLTSGAEESDKPKADHWGLRTLAYPIRKYSEGYYVLYEAKLNTPQISDIERNMTYLDEVLRHLVVRSEG